MAHGRLVAASGVGGHRELIRDGETGTLFAADDPAALARAVLGLLGERGRWSARRRAAREFVERERSWEGVVAGYAPLYARLVAPGG
jgi:glycosyltransferase involved in cell wall biosynthesis